MKKYPFDHNKPWAIHWFRRDLRVQDNPALTQMRQRFEGRVVGLFCFDAQFLARADFSNNRFGFFLLTLKTLREELRSLGGDLLVLDALPEDGFRGLFAQLRKANLPLPQVVSINRDYEPFARQRDRNADEFLREDFGVELARFRDHLIIEPHELLKSDGTPYQVYSPFARAWIKRLDETPFNSRLRKEGAAADQFTLNWLAIMGDTVHHPDQLERFIAENQAQVTVPLPAAGAQAARACLEAFRSKVEDYAQGRDFPHADLTSRLSIYFKNGSITTAQVISALGLRPPHKFLSELIWREFYYHILWHFPQVEKSAFQSRYSDLAWEDNPAHLEAWKQGETGFPIVDAGMRELKATGWMHNRVRMIVASFLTKDLLVDWRHGENHFMKHLLDGDLAPNNGGWQWAASTGCDPQPYFRIFNPWLQGSKFDADAAYIQKWVPELRGIEPARIHDPAGDRGKAYPKPRVDHAVQKPKALKLFKRDG